MVIKLFYNALRAKIRVILRRLNYFYGIFLYKKMANNWASVLYDYGWITGQGSSIVPSKYTVYKV